MRVCECVCACVSVCELNEAIKAPVEIEIRITALKVLRPKMQSGSSIDSRPRPWHPLHMGLPLPLPRPTSRSSPGLWILWIMLLFIAFRYKSVNLHNCACALCIRQGWPRAVGEGGVGERRRRNAESDRVKGAGEQGQQGWRRGGRYCSVVAWGSATLAWRRMSRRVCIHAFTSALTSAFARKKVAV